MQIHTVETLGYDREEMFPRYHKAVQDGRALLMPAGEHEAAQDRVAMRRFIRSRFPDLAEALPLNSMDDEALSKIINSLNEVFPQ